MEIGEPSLPIVASACAITFLVMVICVHIERPELRPASASLSTYFTDSTRAAMFLAYMLLGMALVAFAMQLEQQTVFPLRHWTSAAFVASALFLAPVSLSTRRSLDDPDHRTAGMITLHRVSAIAAFVVIVAAMLTHSLTTTVGIGLAVAAAVNLAVLLLSRPGPFYGLIQKSLVGLIVAWIVLASSALMSSAAHS